jgi:hypothetical protein
MLGRRGNLFLFNPHALRVLVMVVEAGVAMRLTRLVGLRGLRRIAAGGG